MPKSLKERLAQVKPSAEFPQSDEQLLDELLSDVCERGIDLSGRVPPDSIKMVLSPQLRRMREEILNRLASKKT